MFFNRVELLLSESSFVKLIPYKEKRSSRFSLESKYFEKNICRRNLQPAFNESFDLKLEEERWEIKSNTQLGGGGDVFYQSNPKERGEGNN